MNIFEISTMYASIWDITLDISHLYIRPVDYTIENIGIIGASPFFNTVEDRSLDDFRVPVAPWPSHTVTVKTPCDK